MNKNIQLIKPGDEKFIVFHIEYNDNRLFILSICDYLKKCTNILPPIDNKSLFKHFIESSKMIGNYLTIYDRIYNNVSKDLILNLTNKILSIIWCWHKNIRERYEKINDELFCYSYIFSWTNVCRMMFIDLYQEENMEKSGEEFNFIKNISKFDKIIITQNKIKNYTLKELWQSIVLLWPCLYKYSYSIDMKDYFNLLYFKYCSILTSLNNNNFKEGDFTKYFKIKNPTLKNNNEITVLDEYSNEIDYKNIELNIDELNIKHIISSFIFDAEIIFYHQLIRFTITKKLFNYNHSFYYSYNDLINNYERLPKLIDCFLDGILKIIRNEFIKVDIWEGFKNNLSRLFLMHGENERFIRENKMASNKTHTDDILNKIRSNGYKIINDLKEKIPKDLITIYIKEIQEFIEKNKSHFTSSKINFNNPLFINFNSIQFKHEKETIYLTYLCFEKWFSLSVSQLDIKNLFLSEYFTPLEKFEEVIDNLNDNSTTTTIVKVPVLLNIMKHNFIIDFTQKPIVIYHSLIFIESFMIWIILLIKSKILNLDEWKGIFNKIEPYIIYLKINK